VDDREGTVSLSKKKIDAEQNFQRVADAAESGEILEGVVVEVVKGGVIAVTDGIRVFIPASQATASRNEPLKVC
jgi:4-hydroxy-3-methylbut-2-enyl diphosphate reductase